MFICTRCGQCCKNINMIPELYKFDRGNGTCIHLTENNLCNIYATRPDICNVDKMYSKVYKFQMTRDEYDRINMEGCLFLQQV